MALTPKPNIKIKTLFSHGTRRYNIIHSRIRMNCSALCAHLHDMHIIEASSCSCGDENEDSAHFFFSCPKYNNIRIGLINCIMPLAPFNLGTLLYGCQNLTLELNLKIFDSVQDYIRLSNRFT